MQQLSSNQDSFQEIKEDIVNRIYGPLLFHVKHCLLLPPHFFRAHFSYSALFSILIIIGPQLSRQSGKLLTSRSQVRVLVVQRCGCCILVVPLPSKQKGWVRFPSSALSPISSVAEHSPCKRRVISSNLILGSTNDKTHSEADPNGLCYAEA